jgi:hypothetical protein
MLDIPAALIVAFPPSADLLLDRARRHTDDAMLRWIARADYGIMADQMMADLRAIRDNGIVLAPMHWQLGEVLELTRWCNPEAPHPPPFEPGPTGRRGHQTRLFACAVLLRAEAESDIRREHVEDSTLAQCLVSAKVLGDEISDAAARFLTWRMSQMEECSESALFLCLALLILAVRLRPGQIDDRVLANLAEWVLAEELRYRQVYPTNSAQPKPVAFSIQSGFWRPLAAELRDEAAAFRLDDVRTNLQLCALLLEMDPSG